MTAIDVPAEPSRDPQPERLRARREFVAWRVSDLQRRYVDKDARGHAEAVAMLARLRRGVGKPVGALPELWEATLHGLRLPFEPPDEPTDDEVAAYTAITLYGVHQQSRPDRMHRPGQGLGTACRKLRAQSASEEALRRRFEALGTASTFTEVTYHARGLITQLRGAGIPLDYAQFADDLYWLRRPDGPARVRLRWGRDFYRIVSKDGDSTGSTDTTTEGEE